MSGYNLTNEVKEKYTPIIQNFINKLEADQLDEENLSINFSDTELNPYTLWKLLENLGYENEDIDRNGWQMDFWITMTKKGCKTLCISGCGITFEVKLSERN